MTRGLGVRITVLCEDGAHKAFAKALFPRALPNEVRLVAPNIGKGSGKQFVDEQVRVEFEAHRRKSSSQRVWLFVLTDADELSTNERRNTLAGLTGIKPDMLNENVICLIPKWEIETWLLVLRDIGVGVVDSGWLESDKTLKRSAQGIRCRDSVRVFLDLVENRLDRNRIPATNPSLTEGVIEFARFDASLRSHHA